MKKKKKISVNQKKKLGIYKDNTKPRNTKYSRKKRLQAKGIYSENSPLKAIN